MDAELWYALPLGLTLSFAAGPIFFVLLETSVSRGKMAAFSFDLGAILADFIFIAIAYYSSQRFLRYLGHNRWLVILSGLALAAFGAYYVWRARRGGRVQGSVAIQHKGWLFAKGFFMNFLNIGVLFFWITSTVAVGGMLEHDPRKMLVFYGATMATYLAIDLVKIYFANRFKHYFSGRRMQWVELIMGLGLMLFALILVIKS